jgi:hypothetical protein
MVVSEKMTTTTQDELLDTRMMPYLKADDMKDSLMAFQIYLMGKHEAHL